MPRKARTPHTTATPAKVSTAPIECKPPVMAPRRIQHPYTEEQAAHIVDAFVAGETLNQIATHPHMPAYATMLRWLYDNESFRRKMKAAAVVRGFHFFEQALLAADSTSDKDEVPAARLRFDSLKWAAEVSDPETYGKRTTIAGDGSNPIRIVVATGIPEPMVQTKLNEQGLIVQDVSTPEVEGG